MSGKPSLSLPCPEQPAPEWASSTLSALAASDRDPFSDDKSPKPSQSTVSSPGFVAMPGGLPLSEQRLPEMDVQRVALDALETAKRPASVSEMSQNYHPSTQAGVGTFPGPPGEIRLALLSNERTRGRSVDKTVEESIESTPITKTSPIMITTNNNPITRPPHRSDPLLRHTGYIPGSLHDDTSAKLPGERRVKNLLSHDDETAGRLGKPGGIGTFAGSANESGLVLHPDKRKELEYKAPGGAFDSGASTDASIRTLPGSRQDTTDGRPHVASSSNPHSWKDEDGSRRAVEEIPDSEHPSTGVGLVPGGLTGSSGQSHPRKLRFIEKVKGEMKIISGKMGLSEGKTEGGRKMRGKN